MQLEKLLNTMKRLWYFFLAILDIFFNLDFFNLLLVCRGKKANFSFFWLF